MANRDRPRGAWPIYDLHAGAAIPIRRYAVDSSNGTAIFPGDAIIREADGNVAPYTGSGGGNLLGFCVGVDEDYDDLKRTYLPASTAGNVFVADSPYTVFGIQSDGIITADDAGNNADVTATAGDTATGGSRHEVSATTGTATAQLRLLRPINREDNDVTLTNSDWEVLINEHTLKSTTGT
jgi:hypothetical protein